jgi:hypothetical protein
MEGVALRLAKSYSTTARGLSGVGNTTRFRKYYRSKNTITCCNGVFFKCNTLKGEELFHNSKRDEWSRKYD